MKNMIVAGMIMASAVTLAAECKDGVCPLPSRGAMSVVSPVPEQAVQPVAQGLRLETLEGAQHITRRWM